MTALTGEHTYERGARAGNWVAMWVFVMLPAVIVGVAEGYPRGWTTVQVTPALVCASVCGVLWGVVWIRSFNRTRYHVKDGAVECFTVWPRRSWKVWFEDVESVVFEASHGNWSLVLRLRTGGSRRIALTQSMRRALDLP